MSIRTTLIASSLVAAALAAPNTASAASISYSVSIDIANTNSNYFSLPQYDGANGALTGVTFTENLTYPTTIRLVNYAANTTIVQPATFSESYSTTPWILFPGYNMKLDTHTAVVSFTSQLSNGTYWPGDTQLVSYAYATPVIPDYTKTYSLDFTNPFTSYTGSGAIQFVADQVFTTNAPSGLSYAGLASSETYTGTITYHFATASVPEAETYAMMLAGLGLVGFMARRRKQVEA